MLICCWTNSTDNIFTKHLPSNQLMKTWACLMIPRGQHDFFVGKFKDIVICQHFIVKIQQLIWHESDMTLSQTWFFARCFKLKEKIALLWLFWRGLKNFKQLSRHEFYMSLKMISSSGFCAVFQARLQIPNCCDCFGVL